MMSFLMYLVNFSFYCRAAFTTTGEPFDVTPFVDGRFKTSAEEILSLIRTVPRFDKNPMTTIQVISKIGGNMSVFPIAKKLVSWTECCHHNNQSNRKIKSTMFYRTGSYFKPVLGQVANALIKFKNNRPLQTYKNTSWSQESYHYSLLYDPDHCL